MRLYVIRHADPDYSIDSLTPTGHREAKVLAERMEREGITRIYASPMGRAQHTAEYTAKRMGLPVVTEPWTAELHKLRMADGPCPKWMAWDLHGEIIRTDPHHARTAAWDALPPYNQPGFGDIVRGVAEGSDAFLDRLGYRREHGRYRVTAPNAERIAVFCHGGFGLTWLSHLLEIPLVLMWSSFWLSPSSVSCVLLDQRSEEFATPRCLYLADTAHLYAAEMEVSQSGIKGNFD